MLNILMPHSPEHQLNYWRPNPNLKPETNSTTEYGFGFQFDDLLSNNDNLKIKAAHFNTRAKDYIDTECRYFSRIYTIDEYSKSNYFGVGISR